MTDVFYRHLPHYHPPNATFFITFRLAGSLPVEAVKQLRDEKESELRRLAERFQGRELQQEWYKLSKKMFAHYDDCLDRGHGPRWLSEPRIVEVVKHELHHLHPEFYHLHVYCLMPTHGHLLIDLQDIPQPSLPKSGQHYTALSHAMKLFKGRTGYACRKLLGGTGPFWQDESYDHVVRDEKEFERIVDYILNNPVKAGLVKHWQDWPHTYISENLLP